MSFVAARSAIAICNRAFGRIFQEGITGSLDDPQNSRARKAADLYPTVVRTLLEQHHFGLATKRATLVQATNDRAAEWGAAFVPPSDMAFPVGFTAYGASQVQYYRALGALIGTLGGRPIFRYEGNLLYSNLGSAELDYVSLDITEADFNQTFENLVVVFLAAELANPVAKDAKLAKDLYEEGMAKLNQAIAQNLNMQQPTYGNAPTESELVRGAGAGDLVRPGFTY